MRFNYIITIHNKEQLIERVIWSVLMCARSESRIYTVLDGCTDNTESRLDEILNQYSDLPITKLHTNDVHELLSINAGLRAAIQGDDVLNVILQDDVILADFGLEEKLTKLYAWQGPTLGYLSLRLGANFTSDAATSEETLPFRDYIENVYGHGLDEAEPVRPGYLAFRTIAIKSPVVLPGHVLSRVGLLDERLAPYGHDDTDYAIRCLQAGYKNAVFPLRFFSNVEWGGTRENPHPELNAIIIRNMAKIRVWHAQALLAIGAERPSEVVRVPFVFPEDEIKANQIWRAHGQRLRGTIPGRAIRKLRSLIALQ